MSISPRQVYLWNGNRRSLYAIAKMEGVSYPSIQNKVWKGGVSVTDAVNELKRNSRTRMYFDLGVGLIKKLLKIMLILLVINSLSLMLNYSVNTMD